MKNLITILFLVVSTTMYAQIVTIFEESFDNELSESWDHCSGNWGEFQQWSTTNGYLKESSGPYFGRVLNGVLIPPINMEGIENPILELEYALGEIDTVTQLSIYYTSSDSCTTTWDSLSGGNLLEGWNLIANFDKTNDISNNEWMPTATDFQTIQIELDSFLTDPSIRIGIVADYKNYIASGVWYINNLKIYGNSSTNIIQTINENGIYLFPNPATQTVNIVLDEIQNESKLMIFNTTGQLVYANQFFGEKYQLDVADYSKGMYILQCVVSDQILTKKFIVE